MEKFKSAASGGVFRNANAEFIGAFAGKNGICTPLEAELWGIHTGMQKAWEKGYRRVEVENDCVRAVNLVNGNEDYDNPARNIVVSCRALIKQSWEVTLNQIPREQNRAADALAKRSLNRNQDYQWMEEPPTKIISLMRHDELGLLGSANIVRIS